MLFLCGKGFGLWVFFPTERSVTCVLHVQYVFSMVQFVHQLTCLSCLLEIVYLIVAELTCAIVEELEPTSVSPADESGMKKDQYTLRDLVSGNHFSGGLNEAFKKASFSLLLTRFITQTAGFVHETFFFFLQEALKYGFLHLFTWILLSNLYMQ